MSKAQNSEQMDVQQQVKALVDAEEIKLKDLVKFSGNNYGVTVWSQWINGKYEGKVEAVTEIATEFLRRRKALEGLAKTQQFRIMDRLYKVCQRRNELGVIVARSGLGKTIAAQSYSLNYPDVIFVPCIPRMTAAGVLDIIRQDLGLVYKHNTKRQDKFYLIVNALRKHPRLIILDEGNELDVNTLETLRMIHDDGHCGMVIQGDNKLMVTLQSGGGKENLAQLYSRVRRFVEPPRPTQDDIRAYCKYRGMPLNGDKDVLRYLNSLMQNAGEFRKLEYLLDEINDLHEEGHIKSDKPTLEHVKLAQQALITGVDQLKRGGN